MGYTKPGYYCIILHVGKLAAFAMGSGGDWPVKFDENSQTLPSIEVKLAPPEDPLPQVTAEIKLLERSRLRLEEGLMAKLEDAYNEELDNSQTLINDAVERAMGVFNSPNILRSVVRSTAAPLATGGAGAQEATMPAFRQLNEKHTDADNVITSEGTNHESTTPIHSSLESRKNGPLPTIPFSSFLETGSSSAAKSGFLGALNTDEPLPTVEVQLTKVKPPDSKIKDKMEEIEELRAEEESRMFQQAITEFAQLTQITIRELEKSIQLQMNPFLVDTEIVGSELAQQIMGAGGREQAYSFQEKDRIDPSQTSEAHPNKVLPAAQSQTNSPSPPEAALEATSFIELGSETTHGASGIFGGLKNKQMNVKFAQSDKPYPTVDELVGDMQEKRDATERLERMQILGLQLRLLKAQVEMIKDALHTSVARVLAQYAPAVESLKAEVAIRSMT